MTGGDILFSLCTNHRHCSHSTLGITVFYLPSLERRTHRTSLRLGNSPPGDIRAPLLLDDQESSVSVRLLQLAGETKRIYSL